MAKIKEKDFIEIDYTGMTKDEKRVFDTTDEKAAKDNDIYNQSYKYKPAIVCVGEGHLLAALEKHIIGREPGKYTIEIKDVDAFGKKSAKLLKLIPMSAFKKQNVQPMPGLELNIDGTLGVIRTVSGGRVIVDFNHPLSSKDLVYDIDIKRIVDDDKEKVQGYLELLQIKAKSVEVAEGKATLILETELPDEMKKNLIESLKKMMNLKEVAIEKE